MWLAGCKRLRQPQIVYVGVSNFNRLMLSEYAAADGRFHDVVTKMIASKNIPDTDSKASYSAGEYVQHDQGNRGGKCMLNFTEIKGNRSCVPSSLSCPIPSLALRSRYNFHLLVRNGVRYICLAERGDGGR